MPLSIQELLDRSRKELLDLSTRNRLLSIPVNSKSARIIQVYDELSAEVFRMLVNEKKALSFLPGKQAKQPESTDTQLFDTKRSAYPSPKNKRNPGLALPDVIRISDFRRRCLRKDFNADFSIFTPTLGQ